MGRALQFYTYFWLMDKNSNQERRKSLILQKNPLYKSLNREKQERKRELSKSISADPSASRDFNEKELTYAIVKAGSRFF